MSTSLTVLDNLRVATPCPARWEDMHGDDSRRFCTDCSLHVYDFSKMTSEEVVTLVTETEGRVCGRLYRRADGRVITSDCPVGLARARRALARTTLKVAAVILVGLGFIAAIRPRSRTVVPTITSVRQVGPYKTLQQWLSPNTVTPPVLMGDICFVPPAQPVQPGTPGS